MPIPTPVKYWMLGLLLCGNYAHIAAQPLTGKNLAVKVSADQTKNTCYKEIYRDVNAYAQCVRTLAQPDSVSKAQRLGMYYFGFVGALSYMRVSQEGTDQIAYEFLQDYQLLQKSLRITDKQLCEAVAGDCATRIAQIKVLINKPPAQTKMQVRCVQQVCKLERIELPNR